MCSQELWFTLVSDFVMSIYCNIIVMCLVKACLMLWISYLVVDSVAHGHDYAGRRPPYSVISKMDQSVNTYYINTYYTVKTAEGPITKQNVLL